jgi:hypothetical protein
VEGGCRVGWLEDRELKLLQCHSLAMEHCGIAHDFGHLTRRWWSLESPVDTHPSISGHRRWNE